MATGSFRRRRLGRELRRLREERDLRGDAVAKALGIAPSTLSRIETAAMDIQTKNVRLLCSYYGIDAEQQEALLALAREAKRQGWWHSYGDVLPEWFEIYIDLEAEADLLCTHDSNVVNGLLQTEDYARALLTMAIPAFPPEEIDRRVELRMQRQKRLVSGELQLRVVIDEHVLQRVYGSPAVISAQVDRLIETARLSNVSLQVMPTRTPSADVGSFTILEFPGGDSAVVYLENEVGALYLEKTEQVRHYAELYDRLRADALSPKASVEHLARMKE